MADGQTSTRPAPKPQQTVNADVWSALHDAQAEFEAIGKTTKGARSKYAPLDEVLEILGPVIRLHGLTSTALPFCDGEFMKLHRILHHAASNTEIVAEYPVAHISKPPQEIGSALTYARRYSLLAICDVHPTDEDDDGEKANAKPPAKSAYSLKKENVWPMLMDTLRLVESSAELQAWRDAHAEVTAKFPPAWTEQLEEEVEKHVARVKAERQAAREQREALS